MYAGGNWAADRCASSTDIEKSFPHSAHSHAIGELPKRKAGLSQRLSTPARDMENTFTKSSERDCSLGGPPLNE